MASEPGRGRRARWRGTAHEERGNSDGDGSTMAARPRFGAGDVRNRGKQPGRIEGSPGIRFLHVGGQEGGLEEGRRRQTGATGETLVAAGSGRIDSGRFDRGAARPGAWEAGRGGEGGVHVKNREGAAGDGRNRPAKGARFGPSRRRLRRKQRVLIRLTCCSEGTRIFRLLEWHDVFPGGQNQRRPHDAHRAAQINFAIVASLVELRAVRL